jgi:hypothetical protein
MYSVIYHKINISTDELRSMPEHISGFFLVSSFAIDEISQLGRVLLACNVHRSTHPVTSQIHAIQLNSILRNLSVKLLEYLIARGKAIALARQQEDRNFESLVSSYAIRLREIDKKPGKRIASVARNDFGAHFLIDKAIAALKRRDDHIEHTIFINESSINSHYPIGEEVFFLDIFDREEVMSKEHVGDMKKGVDDWVEWIVEAMRFCQDFHRDYVILLKATGLIKGSYEPVFAPMDRDTAVGIPGLTAFPLYWRVSEP